MDLDGSVEQALALLSDDVRARFAADPAGVMRADIGLTVTPVEDLSNGRSDGGACDGVSYLQDGVVLYAPTPQSRRENFTLAHELGHWLVEKATGIYDWLANQDEPARLLETVCDRVAQRLLLPETAVDAVVGAGPVHAQHLLDLYAKTEASRPVCAIALARRLLGLGAIALISRYTRKVTHASVKPDPERGWPTVFPWRGQELSDTHPLLALPNGGTTTRRMSWRTPWKTQADFYIDAIGDARRVVVVFVGADIWGIDRFHPDIDREYDTRPLLPVHCCGTSSQVRGYPCPDCSQPSCPRCGHCRCERQAKQEVRCNGCFLQFLPHLVIGGLCQECRS
jgi:Zn-dependent peptidase ImmA (M78 family)